MTNALIGFTGFVGSTLLQQARFEALYRSTNIGEIENKAFDIVVCAGAQAQKWIANREPEGDLQNIHRLMARLRTVRCRKFILISTADVFKSPLKVDETALVDEAGLHAYGLHRRMLEQYVEAHFPDYLIVRLPGLVGSGLRKNILFDFLNGHHLHAVDCRGVFQFYPMVNLWYDIQRALAAGLRLAHLTAAPISVADAALRGFGKRFDRQQAGTPAKYDLRTCHAAIFGVQGHYQYSVRDAIQAIRVYAQSEPVTLKAVSGAT